MTRITTEEQVQELKEGDFITKKNPEGNLTLQVVKNDSEEKKVTLSPEIKTAIIDSTRIESHDTTRSYESLQSGDYWIE
jgi:hypothetical protein